MCWTHREWLKRMAYAETCIQDCAGLEHTEDVKAVAFWKFKEEFPNCEEVFEEAWEEHVDFLLYVENSAPF
jgi:hypothetical protein